MFIKLLILPVYLILPFTLLWFNSPGFWWIPFALWAHGIVINALVEWVRARRLSA